MDAAEFRVAKARKDMERMIRSSTRNDPKEVYDTVKVRDKIQRSAPRTGLPEGGYLADIRPPPESFG